MTQRKSHILMVEDEASHAELVRRAFDPHAGSFRLSIVGSLAEARRYLAGHTPDLILTDLVLPDGRGVVFLAHDDRGPLFPVVVMTSQGDERAAVDAMKAGALDYVVKSAAALGDMPHIVGRALREWGHIVECRRAEASLAEEKERLAVTLRSIGDGVITTDADGRVTMMNAVAETLTGWSQAEGCGRPLEAVFNIVNEMTRQRCENPVAKVMETGGIVGLANHTVLIGKDGTERAIADSGAPIVDKQGRTLGVVLVFRDVTENLRTAEELQKSQRLESLSILAGGIAHDFNNAMMAIIGNVSLAKLYAEPGRKVFEKLEEIERAALRTKDLTRQLLTFAKGGAPVKRVVSLAEIIKDTAKFCLRGSNVKCRFDIPGDLWAVNVDAGQISQVISNIILNAHQSMPAGGHVDIKAENVTLEPPLIPPVKAGSYVKTTIRDQGTGIPREHIPRIFDPYFTTKQKGSGLGLAMVYSIIDKHEGHITAESEPNAGTTFHVYLPALPSSLVNHNVMPSPIMHGHERVLLMDDDRYIRDVGREMLRELGYEVECARTGEEALDLYRYARDSRRPFDAVILDLTIPGGMGGKEAIQRILEIEPHARAIVSSGYANDPIIAHFREYGFKGAVAKPYRIHELSETLHAVLRGGPNAGEEP
ncbi:response regulator [Desulfococcus sp.]|uniref:ATP-binding response regulator n=1 Tax=Desulfococcus sp. TaxID=2025834 RepID=UPI003593B48B